VQRHDREQGEPSTIDRLEEEARRRAVKGVPEPLVSGGKIIRDDDGQPIAIRRYSDNLLLALLRARRPPRREPSVCFKLPALRSPGDAASAMAALSASVAAGEVTPGQAPDVQREIVKAPKQERGRVAAVRAISGKMSAKPRAAAVFRLRSRRRLTGRTRSAPP
jgi:hypothetical protein